jgi:hypothetical protein
VESEEVSFSAAGVRLGGTIAVYRNEPWYPLPSADGFTNDPLLPVQTSVARYEETAASAGRYQRTVIFPGAGHRLGVDGGSAPGYLARLSAWYREHGTP